MTYTPDSYTRAENAIDEIVRSISQIVNRSESAIRTLNQAESALQELASPAPVGWQEAIAYINAEAAANPDDLTWQALKNRKDKIVDDFQARRAEIAAINTAIENAN